MESTIIVRQSAPTVDESRASGATYATSIDQARAFAERLIAWGADQVRIVDGTGDPIEQYQGTRGGASEY